MTKEPFNESINVESQSPALRGSSAAAAHQRKILLYRAFFHNKADGHPGAEAPIPGMGED
jgi:hypothetical protein